MGVQNSPSIEGRTRIFCNLAIAATLCLYAFTPASADVDKSSSAIDSAPVDHAQRNSARSELAAKQAAETSPAVSADAVLVRRNAASTNIVAQAAAASQPPTLTGNIDAAKAICQQASSAGRCMSLVLRTQRFCRTEAAGGAVTYEQCMTDEMSAYQALSE